MKKAVFAIMPLFVFAMAMSAFAQGNKVDTEAKNAETVKLTISGGLDLDWVWRDRALNATRGVFGTYDAGESRSEGLIHGQFHIRLDADLSEKVRVTLVLDNKRFDGNSDVLGDNPEGLGVAVRQANITMSEVFDKAVTLSVGTSNWTYDVRGGNSAMFWDPAHSATIISNRAGSLPGGNGASSMTQDELQPVGVTLTYNRENLQFVLAILPAIIEGGSAAHDEAGYVASLMYDISKTSRVGVIVALTSDSGLGGTAGDSGLYTVGIGASVKDIGVKGLELFGEAYFQGGKVGTLGTTSADAGGYAFELGVKWVGEGDLMPWIEGKFTYYSGDKDQTATDTDVDAFMSYEHHDDLMILQSDFYGMNWNTNILAFIISGGASFSVGSGKSNLHLKGVVGITKTAQDVTFGINTEDKLGNEFDAVLTYDYSKQVTVDAGAAFLFGSKILESLGGGSTNDNADQSSMLFTIGVNAKF